MELLACGKVPARGRRLPAKLLLIMRITATLLLIGSLHVCAAGFSQSLTISSKRITLEKVFRYIEARTDYSFLWNETVLDKSTVISIDIKDASLTTALNESLKGLPVTYTIREKVVLIEAARQQQRDTTPSASFLLRGKVTDENGVPLPGATVAIKGTTNGAITNEKGEFTLQHAAANITIIVSFIGYTERSIAVGNRNQITVALSAAGTTLGGVNVVSVGYGTLNKKEVSSAITHLTSKELLSVGGNGALMSMQGKVAGLTIANSAAADPNSTPSIQLRGVSSRNAGLGPLYVINGVPGGNIDNLNQNDIESIDVLKGGAASAIYGTRGSNGVIVITTKKGTGDSRLFYDGYMGLDFITNKLSVLSRDEFLAHKRGVDHGGNTDWLNAVSRNPALSQKHTLQFSGGSDRTNFMASADYRKANGIDYRSSKEEYGARVNLNHSSANGLYSVNLNVAPRMAKTNMADYSGFNYALTLNPTLSPYDSTGKYAYIRTGFFSNNPVEAARTVLAQQDIKYLDINGSFKINLLKNLNTILTVGQVNSVFREMHFTPSTNTNVAAINGGTGRNTASQKYDENDQKSFEWIGNYSLDFGKHAIRLLGGYSFQQFTYSGLSGSNENFPSDVLTWNNLGSGLWNLEEGQNNVGSYKNSSRLVAFFGRVNYDLDQKYFLSASIRREGSSKFGRNNKWGYFPAVSAAWRISEEKFMQGISWLNELKLRADYGETGNQDFDNYLSLDTYSGYGYYVFNGVTYQVWGPSQNTNYDLHWEKALNFNLGVDFEVLDSRLTGSLNYYIRTNKDLLGYYAVSNPPNIQGQTYANVGTMKNSGLELQLNANVIKRKHFNYNISFAGASNSNKFVSFSNELFKGQKYIDVVGMPAPGSPGNLQRLQEDKRIGSFYALKSAGVNDNGALLVYNRKGDIVTADKANNDDKQFVGNGLPQFTASLGNTFTYKHWDLNIFLRGSFGYKVFNTVAFYLGTPATQSDANVLTTAYDGSKYSKLTSASTSSALSDYFLESGSFVKIDNVSLGYTQPVRFRYLSSLRVYVTARNLYTFTKFTGGDPDLIPVNGLYPGVNSSLNYYPATTQLLFGAQLNF
ncbi:SusC/RagA family TonB-linked outer membrane protein [Chitinophaga sp. CF418]|uniref:SusC/RagA family TonB-linked outer membrane protein n=1 Tax=Chitinophaga sp. CF418 TaxID=1855287 RepID=UPI00091750F9|nr:SusC/RagA family TonB-linked outer membrane protein [Chitinophaga sp. CF418]SHM72549.1 TonB-linked outer membrane protein, SusC/RagA family [Chitinophaga sp. CF418]